MKKPLTASDWAVLWKLRQAGFALDLLPHSTSGLELEVYPGNHQVSFAAAENLTWVQLPVTMRARSLLSLVAASLFIHPSARAYRSLPPDHLPAETRRIFPSKTFRFSIGGGSVLHLPPRLYLPGCLLLGGDSPFPTLLPGQTLPAELWVRDRQGRYYGTGFSWQGGIELSAVEGNEVVRGRGDQEDSTRGGENKKTSPEHCSTATFDGCGERI